MTGFVEEMDHSALSLQFKNRNACRVNFHVPEIFQRNAGQQADEDLANDPVGYNDTAPSHVGRRYVVQKNFKPLFYFD